MPAKRSNPVFCDRLWSRLEEILERRHMTVADLEKKLELGENRLYAIKRYTPKSDLVARIATALGTSSDWLMDLTDDPEAAPRSSACRAAETPIDYRRPTVVTFNVPPDAKPGDIIQGRIEEHKP